MTYNTGNPVPSTDPRDLDDNSQAFDRFMQSAATQEPDRLGVPRLTWSYVEAAATALVNPNVIGLASLTSGQYKVPMFNNSSGAMVTFDTGALGRTLAGLANTAVGMAAGRTALGALGASDNASSASKLATPRTITATGDADWSVSFDGSADATGTLTLASTVAAGTYTRVTVDAKGRVTAGQTSALAVANGGTGVTTQAAQVEAARAVKPAWTAYTPTITATSGTFTTVTATGKYVLLFGVCHFQVRITVTSKGTGTYPIFTLPQTALADSLGMPFMAKENAINFKAGQAYIIAGLAACRVADYSNVDFLTADGCVININGSYPIA